MSRHIELRLDFHLEVGHFMPSFPEGHPNRRVHGHSYEGSVILYGPVNLESGVLVDMDVLKKKISSVVQELDHRMLNDIPGLEIPSTENVALYLLERFQSVQDYVVGVELRRPTLGMKVLVRE